MKKEGTVEKEERDLVKGIIGMGEKETTKVASSFEVGTGLIVSASQIHQNLFLQEPYKKAAMGPCLEKTESVWTIADSCHQ